MLRSGRQLLRRDRPVIKVRCGAPIAGRAVRLQVDELEPLGDDAGFAGAGDTAVAHRVLQVHQEARLGPVVRLVNQHGALTEQRPEALQHHVNRRVKHRVAGSE